MVGSHVVRLGVWGRDDGDDERVSFKLHIRAVSGLTRGTSKKYGPVLVMQKGSRVCVSPCSLFRQCPHINKLQ